MVDTHKYINRCTYPYHNILAAVYMRIYSILYNNFRYILDKYGHSSLVNMPTFGLSESFILGIPQFSCSIFL